VTESVSLQRQAPPRWAQALNHLHRLGEVGRCGIRLRRPVRTTCAYLGLRARFPATVETRRGTRLRVETAHDLATAWIIVCRDEYRVDPEARCILDLGANFGSFSMLAAERAPAAYILAIEPYRDVFDRLVAHVVDNRLEGRVRCAQVAVAGAEEQRYLSDTKSPSQSRGVLTRDAAPGGSASVTAQTLTQLLQAAMAHAGTTSVDLVKLDIEGGEHELVPGLTPEILAPVRAWQMEYHPNGSSAPLFAALERGGLRLARRVETHPNSGIAWFKRQDGH
jgi:FkbM family methyltransferase